MKHFCRIPIRYLVDVPYYPESLSPPFFSGGFFLNIDKNVNVEISVNVKLKCSHQNGNKICAPSAHLTKIPF